MKLFPRAGALVITAAFLASCGAATEESTTNTTNNAATSAPTATATAAAVVPQTLILVGDTVRGTANLTDEEKAFLTCTQQSRFPQGASIVWRFKVLDPMTAKPMSDKQLKSFSITLPDGSSKAFNYGEHPKGSNVWFWTAAYALAKDYPTGAFSYKILATDLEGRTGSFDQFPVAAGLLQVIPIGTR